MATETERWQCMHGANCAGCDTPCTPDTQEHSPEREAIVRFLREIAGPLPKGVLNGEVWILHRVAGAIERGDHFTALPFPDNHESDHHGY